MTSGLTLIAVEPTTHASAILLEVMSPSYPGLADAPMTALMWRRRQRFSDPGRPVERAAPPIAGTPHARPFLPAALGVTSRLEDDRW